MKPNKQVTIFSQHVKTEQVKYAYNAKWIAWSEEALQRLLNKSEMQTGNAFTLPLAMQTISKNVLSQKATPPTKPNAWYGQPDNMAGVVTPNIFDATETVFNNVPISYEHVTKAMALDDNILDIQEVSNQDQKRICDHENITNLATH
jgi:hypothetical protein